MCGLAGDLELAGLDRILWLARVRSFRPSGFTPAYGSAVRRFQRRFDGRAKARSYLSGTGKMEVQGCEEN